MPFKIQQIYSKILFSLSLFATLNLITPHSSYAGPAIIGEWLTNYGKMTFQNDKNISGETVLTGHYHFKGEQARLQLRQMEQNGITLYSGVWTQKTSDITCQTSVDNTPHWGRVKMIFLNNRFYALWNYCGDQITQARNHIWEGILKKQAGPIQLIQKETLSSSQLYELLESPQDPNPQRLSGQFKGGVM